MTVRQDLTRYAAAAGGLIVLAIALLCAVGWGSAVAAPTSHGSELRRSLIVIRELGSSQMTADKTLPGRFSVLVDGVIEDSGKTVIRPNEGALRNVAGQQQQVVLGTDNLTSKSGTLTISFRGVSISVGNPNPGKYPVDNEYGTWKVASGTGAYQNWRGGGRWADVGTTSSNYIEWDGYVVH